MHYAKRYPAFAAILALGLMVAQGATSQTAQPAPTVVATTAADSRLSTRSLVDDYGAFVGSAQEARTLINGMRAGRDVKVGTVTVSGTGNTMGYGNINHALSLARQQAGTTASSTEFLSSLDAVMDMRASGMGWGQIAKDLGINPGHAISGSKHEKSASKAAGSQRSNGTSVAETAQTHGRGHSGEHSNAGGNGGNSGNGGGGNGGGNGGGGGGKK